ncbi:hypothetical protein K435DRAFT_877117 [Dendrothele bispora CBS 962.96]|uniref:Uncharacterized protein n=1 Tax=Dendrothele bispora (strain CBS 962.96) TaxID=1314807 RepID=A0A4S8KQT2_DENBC|nr:hypothetical protein K435DRAFT_877117 [Dendrothele bispora CBS 962.96]
MGRTFGDGRLSPEEDLIFLNDDSSAQPIQSLLKKPMASPPTQVTLKRTKLPPASTDNPQTITTETSCSVSTKRAELCAKSIAKKRSKRRQKQTLDMQDSGCPLKRMALQCMGESKPLAAPEFNVASSEAGATGWTGDKPFLRF